MVVLLQGFEAFPRTNEIWTISNNEWGFTIAPWAAIGAILMLALTWVVKIGGVRKKTTGTVDLRRGRAQALPLAPIAQAVPPSNFQRRKEWVLDHL